MAVDQATRHEPVRGLPNAPVRMIRGNLDDVPQHDVPSGYSIRWYEPGDDLHWRRIHVECEGYEDISRTLFADEFGNGSLVWGDLRVLNDLPEVRETVKEQLKVWREKM